ncbi:MAG: hypothetical protein UGE23_07665 [Peptococcaceae bacterium]|nr:hypothetical protein [Peptococcaceae bacterium]
MRTMRALFRYEAQNTLKMVASFYGAMFGTMAVMLLIVQGLTGEAIFTSVPGFDFLAVVLGIVVGAVAMSENYRYFKQNGFTRRAILAGDLFGFAFGAVMMATVGTFAPAVVRLFIPGYLSAIGHMYGSETSALASWALLFFSYLCLVSGAYFIGALTLRLGKRRALVVGIVVFLLVMVVGPAIFAFRGPALALGRVTDGFLNFLGFSAGMTPQIWPAVATVAVLCVVAIALVYVVMRRFEWRW